MSKASLAQRILGYHFNLSSGIRLPKGISWLFPYGSEETQQCMRAFYGKYYNDNKMRTLILGINPGRFGAGTTGVPFTDPIRLKDACGIKNDFPQRKELSSVFVYDVIGAYGGCRKFYGKMYISALCPLGFLKDAKNYNYYDDKVLLRRVEPFIVDHLWKQIQLGTDRAKVFCLGQGKNYDYLQRLNARHHFFDEIVPLPHPRWVMQYRLKRKDEFVKLYLEAFTNLPNR